MRLNSRGIGFRFLELGVRLGRRQPNQLGALIDARSALDWGRHDAAARFGGDFRLFLRHQRAGGTDEPRDRLL